MRNILKLLLNQRDPLPEIPPATHDFTRSKRRWGHDITYTPRNLGQFLEAMGWSSERIREGDFILFSHRDGRETRYRVQKIEFFRDPPDMFKATLAFSPREIADNPEPGIGLPSPMPMEDLARAIAKPKECYVCHEKHRAFVSSGDHEYCARCAAIQ